MCELARVVCVLSVLALASADYWGDYMGYHRYGHGMDCERNIFMLKADMYGKIDSMQKEVNAHLTKLENMMTQFSNLFENKNANNKEILQLLNAVQLKLIEPSTTNANAHETSDLIETVEIELVSSNTSKKNIDETSELIENKPYITDFDEDKIWPKNCEEAVKPTYRSGVYQIYLPDSGLKPFSVYCQVQHEENNDKHKVWTLVQRRKDGSINFNRTWLDYKSGFGNLDSEFFLGLDKIHALTVENKQQLWMFLGDDAQHAETEAVYTDFAIGDESNSYKLVSIGKFSGNAGNDMEDHVGLKFATWDHDSNGNVCGHGFGGGWWYHNCYTCNLNSKKIIWSSASGFHNSYPYSHMALRQSTLEDVSLSIKSTDDTEEDESDENITELDIEETIENDTHEQTSEVDNVKDTDDEDYAKNTDEEDYEKDTEEFDKYFDDVLINYLKEKRFKSDITTEGVE